jgi:hypothetical protein
MTTEHPSQTSTAKADEAPAADDSRKPASPTGVSKPTWIYIAKGTLRASSARISALTQPPLSRITRCCRCSPHSLHSSPCSASSGSRKDHGGVA